MSEDILEKWYKAKKQIKELEAEIESYKRKIEKEMNKQEKDKLTYNNYKVSRRRMNRTYISKELVPEEIWEKYKVKTYFDTYYLVKNK